MTKGRTRSSALAALLSLLLIGAAPAGRDWGATLRGDAQAIHDELAANHPGAVNPDDPGFARRNADQFRLALRRAGSAQSYADYFFALRAYVAAFDDGHLEFGVYGNTPSDPHWPLFLTDYDAQGAQRVVGRAETAPVPLGARLVGCDGRSADRLAAENLGRFAGRWSLLSQRLDHGRRLFADYGNKYIRRPVRCTFDVAGRRHEVTLAWEKIGPRALIDRMMALSREPEHGIGARSLADGTRWIALASFDGDPESEAGKSLAALVAALRADRAALAAAPAIVLDLRANGGGSSDWSRQIAEILWGRAALDRLPPDPSRVDWRASTANLDSLREARDRDFAAGTPSLEIRRWYDRVVPGLEGAIARGESLWREPEDDPPAPGNGKGDDGARPRGPVYLVTDAACASACLDAVDLWRALGAVHVGQTTSADTLYMDIRLSRLPSGLGRITVPRKVYRGRARGANQPVVPVHAFPGPIADDAALERWIAALPERRR